MIEHATGKVSITAQNHGFAVEGEAGERFDTPFGPAQITHTCPNDGCVEGLALLVDARRRSACSTTPRPPRARTTPPTCSTGSSTLMDAEKKIDGKAR